MGKSTASCFKIISCGDTNSVDHEDLQTPQSKASSDRHGWSFRKKSARHRALSNNVISESPASASKESPEPTAVNFQVQPDSEKSSDVQWKEEKTELPIHLESKLENTELSTHLGSKLSEEKTELPTHLDSKLSEEKTESFEKTELPTHLDSKLSEEKTELPTHLDSKLSEEKTESVEKTELPTHLDSELSVEKTELPNHLDSNLSEEKSKLSADLDSKLLDTQASREDEITADATLDEPSMAQDVLLKQKNIIKLQAVVRGHIVRRHAVGTLRCVQAIIKMQALVRARQGSAEPANQRDISGQNKIAQSTGTYTYVSVEKLLSNAFARQLMEATPRNNPINIKCDPLKSDSVWKWLERWVAVSSVIKEEVSNEEPHKSGEGVHSDRNKETILVPITSKSTDTESGEASFDDSLTSHDMNNLNIHHRKSGQSNSGCDVTETAPTMLKEADLKVAEVTHLSEKEEPENNRDLTDLNMPSAQQPATEVKKISIKASNPAFIAAQSRFKELTLGATSAKLSTSAKSSTSSSHGPGVESSLDKVSSSTDKPLRSKDTGMAEHVISTTPAVQKVGSECETELNISSTLNSSNGSEAGVNDGDMEIKASEEANHPINREHLEVESNSIVVETDDTNKLERDESVNFVTGDMETKASDEANHSINGEHLELESNSIVVETYNAKKLESDESVDFVTGDMEIKASDEANHAINGEHLELESNSIVVEETDDTNKLEKEESVDFVTGESLKSSMDNMSGKGSSQLVNKSSPEGSPRSHATVSEFQATPPSSQVSVKSKKSKGGEKSGSDRKNRRSSAEKNLSNHKQDSLSSRSSLEQHKSGKRRNSPSSAKSDQEPRDSSSSSNSLPSYMQATQSAKAKAIANASPRSSPDVHDKDIYIKKRHSLPGIGISERQGSPRMHRSLSQVQQSATQSPQDRKWRR